MRRTGMCMEEKRDPPSLVHVNDPTWAYACTYLGTCMYACQPAYTVPPCRSPKPSGTGVIKDRVGTFSSFIIH